MADVNTSILTALEAGYHPQEIMDHIKNSEDPSHQEWYSNYSANMADRAKESEVTPIVKAETSSSRTPLLDVAKNLTPAELAGVGAATLAVVKAPSLYNAYQDRKIEKEKLSIEQRRLNAYEQQVTKQGATPEPVSTVAGQPQGDKLSPLEEARIATERAKAEHIQSKIAIAERAATLREEQAKARANKQPTTGAVTSPAGVAPPTSPAPTNPSVPLNTEVGKAPKEMPLVEESEQNKLKNETANARKQAETEGAPQGWRNQYNRNKTNPIGPSAFNYVASNVEQKGVETPELARKIWEEQYGNKNVSYDQMIKDWSAAKRPERPVSAGVKPGGAGGTPKFIPEYIKGNASLGGMGSLAVMAAALGLGASEKGQAAMAKAAKAIKDIGFSPDILTNKAEEMGRLGTGYVTAGNPVYRKELEQKLQSTNDPQYKKVLQEELDKISSSSNSPYRSVPPPR